MNALRRVFLDPTTRRIRPFWRGQLFLFDRPPEASHSARAGLWLLAIFLLMEAAVRPLLATSAEGLRVAERPWWPLVALTVALALACWLVIRFAGLGLSRLGLRPWSRWSRTERFYFLQTMPLAILVFSCVRSASLQALWMRDDLGEIALFILVPQMLWGFYQELLYRGILQTELVRRWGTLGGILVSNLVFTFGPLHAYHVSAARENPAHWWIFAAIFGIGLLFAILFRRSGNLVLVGIMHGLGDWFIDGLTQVSRLAP